MGYQDALKGKDEFIWLLAVNHENNIIKSNVSKSELDVEQSFLTHLPAIS